MIGYLKGRIFKLESKKVLVLTPSGIGYEVFPTGGLLSACKEGGDFEAFTYLVVREQELTLYGFSSQEEKQVFEKLIGVSGIGPKTAKDIVSSPINLFLKAVEEGDIPFITKIPGIGKKTAERLIIELRGKLDLRPKSQEFFSESPAKKEAIEALEGLGYDKNTITDIFQEAPKNLSTEDLVKYFLSKG